MRNKSIRTLIAICLLVLTLCFATSCKQDGEGTVKDKPGTVYVLNDFETVRDLYSIRPATQYMSATMEIVDAAAGQVQSGEASMKYTFERGNWPDMVLHIKQTDYAQLDIANLNKMNLAVYNDNEKAVNCVVSVVVGGNKTLLTQSYTLEPAQWNDLEFRLSALACQFNADQILGFRFRMEAEEDSVFYFDNWNVTMGAENTDEDNQWEPRLMDIIARIESLPDVPTMQDTDTLRTLYMEYTQLPEVYRNIVPNYGKLYSVLENYVEVKFAAEEDALERKFLAFDEFYGIGQIDSANYAMLYQTEVKFGDELGSIKVTFDGSTKESYFPYHSPLDAKRYDYLEISFFNDDVNRKVIYFNWNQRLVIEPQTWGTMKIEGDAFMNEGNLIVDTIDAQGSRIQSSGTVYIGALHAYRRDLLAELKKLPSASGVQMDRDIKYLTLIQRTMELYNDTPETEKINLPEDLVANLLACYKKTAGYATVLDATQEDIEFGTPDCEAIGEAVVGEDKDYGPVWNLTFTQKAAGAYAAGFRFVKDMGEYSNLFFYIYNPKPTNQMMELYSDGSWNNLEMRELVPGWNKIELPRDVPADYYVFGLFSKNADVVGTWKVSSLYAVSDAIVNRNEASDVAALIEALPDASTIKMPAGLKHVADIWQAYDAYRALNDSGKAGVPASLKNKLFACLEAIEGYKAAINANTDEMTVGTPDCVFTGTMGKGYDQAYGPVYALTVTKIGTGDYAAGFQVNKDISEDKNLFFYIYNPKSTEQLIYLYANPTWDSMGERVLAPGWNEIQLPKDAKIDRYLFGLFPKNADVTGTWKISSVFAKTVAVVDKEEASETVALIEALPAPNTVKMPEGLKYVADIWQAYDAYQVLTANGQKAVGSDLKQKLDDCMTAIEGYKAAINANTDEMTVGTPDCVFTGTMDIAGDKTYGPVYALTVTKIGTGDYAAGFQVNKNISGDENLYFYIYNPKSSAQLIYLYANPTWDNMGERTLAPGWNEIQLPKDAKIDRYLFGLFPKNADVTGTWKISSVFAKSQTVVDKEEAAQTVAQIEALPDASTIKLPDDLKLTPVVWQAKNSYDALSDAARKHITQAQLQKLESCLKAIEGYQVAINALTDEMMVGTPDAPCQGTLNRAEDQTYGPVFSLNITQAGTGPYAGGWQVNKDISAYTHLYFYMYNPKDAAQVMFLYTLDNGHWVDLGSRTLNPGWNKIALPADANINRCIFGLFPENAEITGTWKITSVYGLDDALVYGEAVAELEQRIQALKAPAALTLGDKADVDAVRDSLELLPAAAQALVSQESKAKLEACEVRIVELIRENAITYVNDLIDALPEADTIIMPESLKWAAPIHEAEQALEDLDAEQKDQISLERKDKLSACAAKIAGFTVIFDAKADNGLMQPHTGTGIDCTATVTLDTDDTYGNVFKLDVTAKAPSGDYGAGFFIQKEAALADVQNLVFFMYNPTGWEVYVEFYGDNWAKSFGSILMAPGWNKVILKAQGEVSNSIAARIPFAQNAVGAWKVTTLFSVSDAELVKSNAALTEAQINALPEATALQMSHKEQVEAAKAAFDALSNDGKALVSQAAQDKLTACVAKITELSAVADATTVKALIADLPDTSALQLTDKEKVNAAKTAYDNLSEMAKELVPQASKEKLSACLVRISELEAASTQPAGTVLKDATSAGQIYVYDQINGDTDPHATVTVGTDAQKGNVFQVTYKDGATFNKIGLQFIPFDMTGYDTVEFYVYNPGSSAVNVSVQENGGDWAFPTTQSAAAGEWTKVTVNVADYKATSILVYFDGVVGQQYKISSVIGYN